MAGCEVRAGCARRGKRGRPGSASLPSASSSVGAHRLRPACRTAAAPAPSSAPSRARSLSRLHLHARRRRAAAGRRQRALALDLDHAGAAVAVGAQARPCSTGAGSPRPGRAACRMRLARGRARPRGRRAKIRSKVGSPAHRRGEGKTRRRKVLHHAATGFGRRLAEAADRGVAHHLRELGQQRGVPARRAISAAAFAVPTRQGVHWPQDSWRRSASGCAPHRRARILVDSTMTAAEPMKQPCGCSVSKSSGMSASDAGRMPPEAPPGR
jgi:hypothetical protein